MRATKCAACGAPAGEAAAAQQRGLTRDTAAGNFCDALPIARLDLVGRRQPGSAHGNDAGYTQPLWKAPFIDAAGRAELQRGERSAKSIDRRNAPGSHCGKEFDDLIAVVQCRQDL